ncbi:ATP-binding protein [Rhodobacter capsulatus]|uniref:ATP-binding protein n=1 Tax=Rhodobacter capsulatus TaxID=1061 RepID=UPI0003D34D8E|nr:ATP-binding protein [Rhodobacter capsulatus]ETD85270.1 transposase [Rhodobacter capsulatus B6]
MNDFIIDEIVDASESFNGRLYPLERAKRLKRAFAEMFSWHLGRMRSGNYFEAEVLVVTGQSGTGKTAEIEKLMRDFHASNAGLPEGRTAKFPMCVLDRKGSWKDLGRNTLDAMGYPLSDKARLTQAQIARRIKQQGALQGIVGIWYDEAQHIMATKNDVALLEVLDCFKTMVKGPDWPMMLILSGVPELADSIPKLEQLFRKVTHVRFDDIDFEADAEKVNSIVGSYAIEAGLEVDDDLITEDFLHRLVTAGAFRWGVVFYLVMKSVGVAVSQQSGELTIDHFVQAWVDKTNMNPAATPFTHSGYQTMFRRENPFQAAISR